MVLNVHRNTCPRLLRAPRFLKARSYTCIERELHIAFCSILIYVGKVNYMHRSLYHANIQKIIATITAFKQLSTAQKYS